MIRVEVAYALPEDQEILALDLPSGTTAIQAVEQSGILQRFPSIDPVHARLGIFGKAVSHDCVLQAGDRVEIYRQLIIEPGQARHLRAKRAKKKSESVP
jgi:putative ubiquitin-RnfH superfamily antitoxin RatB of RatAB toxin-antitoxin module